MGILLLLGFIAEDKPTELSMNAYVLRDVSIIENAQQDDTVCKVVQQSTLRNPRTPQACTHTYNVMHFICAHDGYGRFKVWPRTFTCAHPIH